MTRLFVEKKPGFRTKAVAMQREISEVLGISAVSGVRLLQRYDLDNLRDDVLRRALHTVFADPVSDTVSYELALSGDEHAFAYAYHPGQFDQRADSAAQALNLLGRGASGFASVSCASVVVLSGAVSAAELERIQRYLVNPVDSQIVPVDRPVARESAAASAHIASQGGKAQSTADTASLEDGERSLEQLRDPANRALVAGELGLAMRNRDLEVVCEFFFDSEHRPPSVTELSIIDTYWSDHCRHTTFLTELQNITIADDPLLARARSDYRRYRQLREELGVSAGESLMDIATIGGKHARAKGRLADLEVTDEINAASLRVSGPGGEPWLLMVKNETHNHPTEIEPYGGAATCLGGAIRDPLSERSYVFQAARVTGSGDPRTPVSETWPGKLPQRTITTEAAQGFSSYGNQIGLTTGMVEEVYHPGYVAKRLEIGAVCGAAPQLHVHRSPPEVGDRIVLVGGRTGRDGCGGATGSSKAHDEASIEQAGAEVQKGNPPVERALQRLFRRPEAAALIKRCNDFGAGGVSVAIGELAEGVDVDLDVIPVKYRGLTPRELAISESQERMAVVLAPSDVQAFLSYADAENLEATVVATVTDRSRLRMYSEGSLVADIERSFLESHGAPRRATAYIAPPARQSTESEAQSDPIGEHGLTRETWLERVGRLDVCSRRGLTEMFDSTVGAGTAMAPLGGAFGATPEEAAVCELPTAAFGRPQSGETVSTLSYGFDPVLSSWSPYHGAYLAVVESVCRLVAVGARPEAIRLSLQEYFPRPGDDAKRWGLPAAALLGALGAQLDLGVPAVGGKDSMSGSFNAYDVPPTLVSFAVSAIPGDHVTGAAFSRSGSAVLLLDTPLDGLGLPHMEVLLAHSARIADMRAEGVLRAAGTIRRGGLVAALTRACLGNRIGIDLDTEQLDDPGAPRYGSFYVEVEPEGAQRILGEQGESPSVRWIGTTGGSTIRTAQWELDLATLEARWTAPLSEVFPVRTSPGTDGGAAGREAPPVDADAAHRQEAPPGSADGPDSATGSHAARRASPARVAKPRVLVPVFPGTNCEFDTARAFERAGAVVEEVVFRNRTPEQAADSVVALAEALDRVQMLCLAGGFSAGDEPDGSGKYIAAAFRASRLSDAVMDLIERRDGLVLGICNGFQALVRLGLVPYGEIRSREPGDPILTRNAVGRHVSQMVRTRVVSTLSPWFALAETRRSYAVPVSHGEGRFMCSEETLQSLRGNGQIAAQYVDYGGVCATEMPWNPNGSVDAVEALSSPDGRVLGKMAHNERVRPGLYRNFPETGDMGIFESGTRYFA